jgi:Predicted membrane protein (DUF2142)
MTSVDEQAALHFRVPNRATRLLEYARATWAKYLNPNKVGDLSVVRDKFKVWATMFAVFFAITAAYVFATPLGTGGDEPAHMVWAAAVTTGQVEPQRISIHYPGITPKGMVDHWTASEPRVPEYLADLQQEEWCVQAVASTKTGTCGPLNTSHKIVKSMTYFEEYNPVYYAIVGLPIHFASGIAAMYLMRLVSAALVAALIASAATLAWRVGRIAFAGVVTGASPMMFILSGTVNPQAVEAAAGLLAWSALAALAYDWNPQYTRSRLIGLVVGSGIFTLVRPAGLEWLALFACVAALALRRRRTAELLRRIDTRISLAALALIAVLAEAWDHFRGGINVIPFTHTRPYTLTDSLVDSARSTPTYLLALIAGDRDSSALVVTVAAICIALGLLVLLALALTTGRQALALVAVAAGILLIPFAANAVNAVQVGNLWTGRYLMWWAVGLPILAATIVSTYARPLPTTLLRRLPILLVSFCVLGNLSMYWLLVRYYKANTSMLWPALLAGAVALIALSVPWRARGTHASSTGIHTPHDDETTELVAVG